MEPREKDVQKLLEVMDKELRDNNRTINFPYFNFEDPEDEIIIKLGWNYKYFLAVLKKCDEDGYIKPMTVGRGGLCDIALTTSGRQKAIHDKRSITRSFFNLLRHPLFCIVTGAIIGAIASAIINKVFFCSPN